MKRLFSVIVLVAVLTIPFAANAQPKNARLIEMLWSGDTDILPFRVEEDSLLFDITPGPVLFIDESTGEVVSGTLFEYTVDHPAGKEGDFGLFPFLGKSFYKFVLKPAYVATKASGKTGGKAVKFFFVQIGHFLF